MIKSNKKNLVIGALLMIPYSCAIGAILYFLIPSTTVWVENSLQNTGPLIVLVIIALLLIAFLVSLPLMLLSKSFLECPNKPLAVVCGLIVGLPVTIGLIINVVQELYSGPFTMGCIVMFGGIAPIFFAYYVVANPSEFRRK